MNPTERERNPTEKERTSLGVYDDTKARFDDSMPYDSMSADEFVDVLLDKWEGRR